MKFTTAICLSLVGGASSFVPMLPVGFATKSMESASALEAYPGKDHVVKNGGGIAVVETGDFKLFDPRVAGLLGGTPDMDERLQLGASFPPQK